MAKRVATKSLRMWAHVNTWDGVPSAWRLHASRDEARAYIRLKNLAGAYRIEPVMVTPIKRKAR